MKLNLLIPFFLLFYSAKAQMNMEEHIKEFYTTLNKGDSIKLKSFFHEDAVIENLEDDTSYSFNVEGFLKVCEKFSTGKYQENILLYIENPYLYDFQTFDVYFEFFIDGKLLFCGMDHFVFSLKNNEFKILKIYSINSNCDYIKTERESIDELNNHEIKLNRLLDYWHLSASEANLKNYFDLMSDDFVFLGTDPKERWTKSEFLEFCKPYFEKEKTWHFASNWRNWYFSADGKTAWFEESLTTQMDECRGSGVFVFEDGQWKISHYNLTVLIENEKMKKFLKLRSK